MSKLAFLCEGNVSSRFPVVETVIHEIASEGCLCLALWCSSRKTTTRSA